MPSEMLNVTSSVSTSMSISALVVVIGLVIFAVLVCIVYEYFKVFSFFNKLFKVIRLSFEYFVLGVGTVFVFGVVGGIMYYLTHTTAQGNILPIKILGIGVGIYVGLTCIGFLTGTFLDRIQEYRERVVQVKPKKS